MRLIIILLLCGTFSFGQKTKSKVVKPNYDKNFTENLIGRIGDFSFSGLSFEKFKIGDVFDPLNISDSIKPKSTYNKDGDYYLYVFSVMDEWNNFFVSYKVKNNRIFAYSITFHSLEDFLSLLKYFKIFELRSDSERGYRLDENNYLVIAKEREDFYDRYNFFVYGLEQIYEIKSEKK